MNVGHVIKELRKQHRLTQVELAQKLDVAPTAVSAWEGNKNRPLMDKIVVLAEIFGVPVTRFFEGNDFVIKPVGELVMLPIVGHISCSDGLIAFEDVEGYEATPRDWIDSGDYFYLRAKGDSMIGARIHEDDLLLIRKQDEVEDGEISVVMIDNEAVLKRVRKQGSVLVLQSENSNYPLIFCTPETSYQIIGKLERSVIKF